MPWQLTTPLSVGQLDSADYDQIRITSLMHDSVHSVIVLNLEYGNTVDGAWVAGYAPKGKDVSFTIKGASYTTIVSHMSNDNEPTYAAVKRGLYEWLEAEGYIDAGSVV